MKKVRKMKIKVDEYKWDRMQGSVKNLTNLVKNLKVWFDFIGTNMKIIIVERFNKEFPCNYREDISFKLEDREDSPRENIIKMEIKCNFSPIGPLVVGPQVCKTCEFRKVDDKIVQ